MKFRSRCGTVVRSYNKACTRFLCKKNNSSINEREFKALTKDEFDVAFSMQNELLHIASDEFQKLRPKKEDCFGCIEMCDHLKNTFNLSNDVYELAGMLNYLGSNFRNAKMVDGDKYMYEIPMVKKDGREWYYNAIYYLEENGEPSFFYKQCTESQLQAIKDNPRDELLKIIECVKQTKCCSRYASYCNSSSSLLGGDEWSLDDHDFTFEEMNEARKILLEKKNSAIRQQTINNARNQMVEQLTRPRINADPNYISTATCPTCGKKDVYRISNTSRAVSLGTFGLLSKKIGKTMECKSCGYMW